MVHLVLHPHGISPTYNWICGRRTVGEFYSYYIHQGNVSEKERKFVRKKCKFYASQIFFKTFLLKWVQFRVGAIPRSPKIMVMIMKIKNNDNNNKNNNNDDDICLVPAKNISLEPSANTQMRANIPR